MFDFWFILAVDVIGLVPECPCLLAYVPAMAHISTGFLSFRASLLGKNVKHHSLDKEPSIIDIFLVRVQNLLSLMREKIRKKMLLVCEIV